MLFIKDKVILTEEAKKDTYPDEWWINKKLIINHIDGDKQNKPKELMYSFVTEDGEDVPNSLYEYELILFDSDIPGEIRDRLSCRFELDDFNPYGDIDESDEIDFLENIVRDFSIYDMNLDTSISENMVNFYEYSFENKLEIAKYIEDYIDEFIKDVGVINFRQALDGGIREYLYAQFFSNSLTIYKNSIINKINEVQNELDTYDEDTLGNKETIYLNFDSSEICDLIEDFINEEFHVNYIYDGSAYNLYEDFCDFLSEKLENNN